MKKRYIGLLPLLIAAAMLASCSGRVDKVATPGQVIIASSTSDALTDTGYTPLIPSNNEKLSAFSVHYSDNTVTAPAQSLTYRNTQYDVNFVRSAKPSMHISGYDVYYTSSSDSDISSFYTEHGTDKVIGYMKSVPYSSLPAQTQNKISEAELVAKAQEELGEFIDTSYYAHTGLQYDEMLPTATITFYNTIGEIMIADSSTVEMLLDGTVIKIVAISNPELRQALSFSDLDAAAFDAAVAAQLEQAYQEYHRDDEQMLADIIYESISIKTRLLSLDDDGRPVVLYYVTPQLSYDITYRGDLAATAAEKDIDVHQTGVYEPPVYVAVYVE